MSLKKMTSPFTVEPADRDKRLRMDLLSILEEAGPLSSEKLHSTSDAEPEFISEFISAGFKANIIQLTAENKLQFRSSPVKLLGVAFCNDECILQVVNPKGTVVKEERIKTISTKKYKGTKTDTNKIARDIRNKTGLKKEGITACGFVIPQPEDKWTTETVELLAFSLQKIFKCPAYFTREPVACGYAQKTSEEISLGQNLLYVHSDIGDSVVFKKGAIYDSSADKKHMGRYLSGWEHFGLVETARELIDRGLGTDMISMIGGDLEKLDVKTVFRAARAGDELATDLVERSALALGVRIAYLVNMFEVQSVLFPQELTTDGGLFTRHVKESSRKFFHDEKKDLLEIVPGVMDNMCASYGAALLCRRQLIMEV